MASIRMDRAGTREGSGHCRPVPGASSTARRRADSVGGQPIPLADGETWWLAGPAELAGARPEARAEVAGLLTAVATAEDAAERGLAELALAVALLACNYELGPADYRRLLAGPIKAPWRHALRELIGRYRDAAGPPRTEPAGSTNPAGLGRSWWRGATPCGA